VVEVTETFIDEHSTPKRSELRTWPLFVAIGLVLYAALYAWSENLIYAHADHNRFFRIATAAPNAHYDNVILGASHALPLDYADMNMRLEAESGTNVLNLANEGAGILPNQLMLDYFYARGLNTDRVVLFLDSFAFASPRWNEDRLDTAMLQRAPFDPVLLQTLWRHPWARDEILPYASGFFKINNQDRFAPDQTDAELTKFDRTYRPIPQIDRERIAYLYSDPLPGADAERYHVALQGLIQTVRNNGGDVLLVKPPTPPRYRDALPDEASFDDMIAELVEATGVQFQDYSEVLPDDANYYDTDHLNRTGVLAFIDKHFGALLAEPSQP
jgi:hypothetical protein